MSAYRYYKWEIIGIKSSSSSVQASEFEFYSDSFGVNKIPLSSYPVSIHPYWTSYSTGEAPEKLFDANIGTKWYIDTYQSYKGSYINPYDNSYQNVVDKFWISIDTGSINAIAPLSYGWITGNDVIERDPTTWKLYGSNDNTTWTTISEVNNFNTTNDRRVRAGVFQLTVVPPTNVIASTRYQSARVSWNPATSGANSYIVTANPGNMTQTTTSNSLIFNGLTNGTSYTFTVQTVNYAGTSIASSASNAVVPAETVADSPTNIKAQFNGNTAVVIWDAPTYTGGVAITDYSVSVNPGNINITSTSGLTKANITGLPLNTTLANSYTISVSAINSIGTSQAGVLTSVINDTPIVTSFKAGYNTQDNNYKLEWPLPNETPELYELTVNGASELLNGKITGLTYSGLTDRVVKVESTAFHTLFLMQNGEVRAMGENGSSGKCGQATSVAIVTTPTAMLGIDWTTKKALKIATSQNMSAILLNDNTLRVYGFTLEGTYSTVPINYSLAPIGSAKIVDMKCGSGCVFLLLDNGKVMARGGNNWGQLGNGTFNTSNTTFTDVSGINYLTNPVKAISTDSNQARVSLVMQDGTVMFIGNNNNNYFGLPQSQVTLPTKLDGIDGIVNKAVKTIFNEDCLIALLDNGKVMSIGRNTNYGLGLNTTDYGYTIRTFTPITTIDGNNIKLKDIHGNGTRVWIGTDINENKYATGSVYYIGIESTYYKPTLVSSLYNFIEFVFLYFGFFALNASGKVYHGGYEYLNTLGTNTADWTFYTFRKYRDTSIITAIDPATSYTFSLSYINKNLTTTSIGNALVGNLSNSISNLTLDASNSNVITNWSGTATSFNVFVDSKLYANTTQNSISIPITLAFSNINIGIQSLSLYGSSSIVSLSKNIIKSPNEFYSKYNSTNNVYELSFDIDPEYPEYLPIQVNVNEKLSLMPRYATNKFSYSNTPQPIKIFINNSNWNNYNNPRYAVLMSDGTVRLRSNQNVPSLYSNVYNTSNPYVTIPDLSNVKHILTMSSIIANPYAFIYLTTDNRMKVMNSDTGAIVDCTDLSNIPFSWNGNQLTSKVDNIITAGFNHFVTSDGRVYKYVSSNDWYKGEYTNLTNIKDMTYSYNNYNQTPIVTYALSYDGKVYSNTRYTDQFRLLGIGAKNKDSVSADTWYLTDLSNVSAITNPITIGWSSFALVLLKNGTLMYVGEGGYETGIPTTSSFVPVPGITGVVSISTGRENIALQFSNGDVALYNWYSGLQYRSAIDAVSITYYENELYVVDKNGKVSVFDGWGNNQRIAAPSSTIDASGSYVFKARGILNNNIVGPYVNSTLPPLSITESIPTTITTESSVKIRLSTGVVEAPVVTNIATATPNSTVVVADTSISSTPIVAFVAAPTNDAQIASAVTTTVNNGLNRIVLKQTVAGQEVKSLVTTQSSSVSTPLPLTSSSGATASITTNSAGAGNIVAASITNLDVSNSYVNMFIKVVSSSGSVVASGFNVPIELNIPAAAARDTVVLRRFNTSTNSFETVGTMTKKSGTTSTFQYTLTTNSNLTVVPCILGHTKVMTPRGPVAAAFLKNGDIVVTSEGRQVAIRQIYTSSYVTTKETAPYKFEKGCLGKNYPAESFEISPTHAVATNGGWIIPKYASLSGVKLEQVMVGERVKYYHVELENYLRDNLVLDGGAVVESFGVNWLKTQPKGTVVYTFDHKSKLFTRPSYKSMKKITINRK